MTAIWQGHKTYRVRGTALAAIVAVCVAALAYAGNAVTLWVVYLGTDRAIVSGDVDAVTSLEGSWSVTQLAAGVTEAVALTLTIVWMWRARKNLDAFPDARPVLSAGWAIGGWFLPVANAVIPARMMVNLARESTKEAWVRAVAVVWWLALVVHMAGDRLVANASINRAVDLNTWYGPDELDVWADHYRQWALDATWLGVVGVIAAVCFGLVVLWISDGQESRIARGQYEDDLRVMGITPPAAGPPAAGGATIGA